MGAEPPCLRQFLEFAFKLEFLTVQICQFHLNEFLHFHRNKLNYLGFDLHLINNKLQTKFVFVICWYYVHFFLCTNHVLQTNHIFYYYTTQTFFLLFNS